MRATHEWSSTVQLYFMDDILHGVTEALKAIEHARGPSVDKKRSIFLII
jgi:hypothetical protein